MKPLNIVLLEEGDPNSGLRTRNAQGEKARNVLIDRGNSLILQATLVSVTYGDFAPDGDGASLLIFEFVFIGKRSHRFASGSIKIQFEDVNEDARSCPVVWAISPSGNFAINEGVSKRDVRHAFNTNVNLGFTGVTGGVGYTWDTSEDKETEHSARLAGLTRAFGAGGRKNGAIWMLEEDPKKKRGIPSFLRVGMLLRRRADGPFRFTISVDTKVDFEGKLLRLLGFEKADPVDAVELSSDTDLDALDITSLNADTPGLDLTDMQNMDIGSHAHVVLATLLSIPE